MVQILNTFNCKEVHGKRYLLADMRLSCDSAEHKWYISFASVAVLMYPVGIPIVFLAMMIANDVPALAYYKEARVVVLKCIYEVALYDKVVMRFVKNTPENERFEGIPDKLFARVVQVITSARLQEDADIQVVQTSGVQHIPLHHIAP